MSDKSKEFYESFSSKGSELYKDWSAKSKELYEALSAKGKELYEKSKELWPGWDVLWHATSDAREGESQDN